MSNTYTQIHIHAIFAVQNRICLIRETWKNELYKYITGIIQKQGHRLLIINGMPDHIHLLMGTRPVQSLSNLMQDIKGGSSKWINDKRFVQGRFSWQEGYGAFSYSKSQLSEVARYIENQEKHHKNTPFLDEYMGMLKANEIDYSPKYLFKQV